LAQVSSYILTEINGKTAENPKAAEGEIWIDPNASGTELPKVEKDTTVVIIDSTTVAIE